MSDINFTWYFLANLKDFYNLTIMCEEDILENFIYNIPWTHKSKYINLKQICVEGKFKDLVKNVNSYKIARGLMEGLNIPHLVCYTSDAYRTLLNVADTDTLDCIEEQIVLELLICDPSTIQLNAFKYAVQKIVNKRTNMIDLFFTRLSEKNKIDLPLYSIIKILQIIRNDKLEDYYDSCQSYTWCVPVSLNHQNENIRLAAFCYMCESKPLPLTLKFIKTFLIQNASVESMSVRNMLIKEFSGFMLILQRHLYGEIKNRNVSLSTVDFFVWLSFFIKRCLDEDSYQRRKLCLMFYDIIMKYYIEQPGFINKGGLIKKGVDRNMSRMVKDYLISHEKWSFEKEEMISSITETLKDNNNDIAELAKDIILNYFCDSEKIDHVSLKKSSDIYLRNPLFYVIESGTIMLEVVYRVQNNISDSLDHIISRGKHCVESLLDQFKTTIMSDNEIYAVLLVLTRFRDDLTSKQIENIVEFLENLIPYLLCTLAIDARTTSDHFVTSPSFGEMAIAISRLLDSNIDEELMSDEEQLLLNRIWRNLKACCELLSLVGQHHNDPKLQKNCLMLLMRVLLANRHKGVIEATGRAVIGLVKHMTKTPESAKVVDDHVQSVLNNIANGVIFTSYTRRTAGLSILVHSILVGDQRLAKGLATSTIRELMQIATSVKDQGYKVNSDNCKTVQDKPLAVALHCLRPIVFDSGLWTVAKDFATDLFHICIDNISNQKDWSVRNASLHLFSALQLRILGQTRSITLEKVYNKYPKLLPSLLAALEKKETSFIILSFLSKAAPVNSSEMSSDFWSSTLKVRERLWIHIEQSNNAYATRLAAKSLCSLYPISSFQTTVSEILQKIVMSKNMNTCYGYAVTLTLLMERIIYDGYCVLPDSVFVDIRNDMKNMIGVVDKVPPFVGKIIHRVWVMVNQNSDMKRLAHIEEHEFLHWHLKNYINDVNDVHQLLNVILFLLNNRSDDKIIEPCVSTLELFVEDTNKISQQYKIKFALKLFECLLVQRYSTDCKTRLENILIDLLINVGDIYSENKLNFKMEDFKCLDIRLPLKCSVFRFLPKLLQVQNSDYLCNLLVEYSNPDRELNLRLDAAKSLCLLTIYKFPEMQKTILKVTYLLLSDLDVDVSDFACVSIKNIKQNCTVPEHNYCQVFFIVKQCCTLLQRIDAARLLIDFTLGFREEEYTLKGDRSNPYLQFNKRNKCFDNFLIEDVMFRFSDLFCSMDERDKDNLKEYFISNYESKFNYEIVDGDSDSAIKIKNIYSFFSTIIYRLLVIITN